MSTVDGVGTQDGTAVVVRYWAAARAAAGVESERLGLDAPAPVSELVARLVARRGGDEQGQPPPVLDVCSVPVGGRPTREREALVRPGGGLEVLPPLARVLDVCSVLVGDRPTREREALVRPGESLEFLPPFAGG